jgi:hypothetical protein
LLLWHLDVVVAASDGGNRRGTQWGRLVMRKNENSDDDEKTQQRPRLSPSFRRVSMQLTFGPSFTLFDDHV